MPCRGDVAEVFEYDAVVANAGDAGMAGFGPGQMIEVLTGLLGRELVLTGIRLPEKLPDVDPPRTKPIGPVKDRKPPARNDWAKGPIEGPLTRERVERLERAGLGPRLATVEEVRKVLGTGRR